MAVLLGVSRTDKIASLGLVRLFQVEDMLVSLPGRDQVDPGVLLKSGPSSFRTYNGPFPFRA